MFDCLCVIASGHNTFDFVYAYNVLHLQAVVVDADNVADLCGASTTIGQQYTGTERITAGDSMATNASASCQGCFTVAIGKPGSATSGGDDLQLAMVTHKSALEFAADDVKRQGGPMALLAQALLPFQNIASEHKFL